MLFVLSVSSGLAQKKSDQAILLLIDNRPTYVDEFVYLYKKNHQGREEEFTKEKIEEYLELFINFKLKVREADERKLGESDAFKKELNGYKEELRKPFIAESDLLDKLVEEAYARLTEEVKASHILIGLTQNASPSDTLAAYSKAVAVIEKLRQGADFEKLAAEISEDPSAKTNGGLLGYFTALQMVYPFEHAAYQLEVGEISNPVRSKFGYHVIKVLDKRPSRGEVEVSHILIRGADDGAKASAYEVYNKLQGGADWNQLCKDYSQDPGTKESGGRLRPFGSGALASAPQFEEVAFSLKEPGAISAPFQTSFGWHIVRLEKKILVPPLQELRPSLERRVARDDRMAISKSKVTEKRKEQFNFIPSDQVATKIALFADSSLIRGKWSAEKVIAEKNEPLFKLNNHSYIVSDFGRFIEANQTPVALSPGDQAQKLFDSYVEELLAETEDSQLQQSNPEYKTLVNEYREGILLFSIMEQEVWNKASEDSVGQRNFYQQNMAKYQAGNRVEARIFSTTNQSVRDSVLQKIQQGDTLTASDLKKFKSVSPFRAYEKGEHKAIDLVNWTIGVQKADADGMYYLVEINRLVPPGYKEFEEIRATVISDYQDYLEKIWIDELKSKYAIRINAKGKKKAIAELTSEK